MSAKGRTPPGDPNGYSFTRSDPNVAQTYPISWSECRTHTYKLRKGMKKKRKAVKKAFRKTYKATGVRFKRIKRGKPDILVRYKKQKTYANPLFRRLGQMRPVWVWADASATKIVVDSATIEIDPRMKRDPRHYFLKVMMHEIGHSFGLYHTLKPYQVMKSGMLTPPIRWGAGDLTGLRIASPCR